jgi:tetratricopeptide (TPR) repeat protein
MMALGAGASLGRYELGELLGEGGSGRVYAAVLRGPGGVGRPVALKVLRGTGGDLKREARLGGLLRHRHLVDVYEVGEHDGQWFCAMERCVGRLSDHVPLPPRAVVEVGLQVCDALRYAHADLGLVHLDLKPDNLLLAEDGSVKVADLGVTRAVGFELSSVRGTPGYMAPEQARGAALDARADVYALAVTLTELATGTRGGSSATMDLDAITEVDEVEVPAWLSHALEPALAIDPVDRCTMTELADALRAVRGAGSGLRHALGWTEPPARPVPEGLGAEQPGFVGREAELDLLARRLATPGVVTLKGAAGVGKSRLGAAAARQWEGPARRAALGEVHTLDGATYAVASALGVRLGSAPVRQLGHVLGARGAVVLVLDDADRVPELARVVSEWLALAPEARFLVTARAPLGLPAEHVVEVAPLGVAASIALVTQRARLRGVEVEGHPALPELVRRLDGIPLALELAAGRLGVLSLDEVVERIDLALLRRASTGRHATLRDAIAWSWELLSVVEQSAMAQLAVFVSGFSLEAADEVVDCAGDVLLDVLGALLDRSMVSVRDGRYQLLASVRAFAAEHLTDRDVVVHRHGAFFARLGTRDGGRSHRRDLARDLENLMAACTAAVGQGEGAVATGALRGAWEVLGNRGPFAPAAELADQVLTIPSLSPADRARVLYIAALVGERMGRAREARRMGEAAVEAAIVWGQPRAEVLARHALGDHLLRAGAMEKAEVHYRAALALARQEGLRKPEAVVLCSMANLYGYTARVPEALPLWAEAQATLEELGDRRLVGGVYANRGAALQLVAELQAAEENLLAALPIQRAEGDRAEEAKTLGNLGAVMWSTGRPERAREMFEAALVLHDAVGSRRGRGITLANLSTLSRLAGNNDQARRELEEALEIHRETGNVRSEGVVLANLGALLADAGERAEARALYQQALDCARAVDSTRHAARALGALAALEDDAAVARPLYDEALRVARGTGDSSVVVDALVGRGMRLAQLGDLDAARLDLADAVAAATAGDSRSEHAIAVLDAQIAKLA